MKQAKVRARRTLTDGRKLLQVVCPVCQGRHWVRDTATGHCPRRPGRFTIGGSR